MEKMGLNEIREEYLKFFEGKGHLRLPSFSLVPNNDKSLLLINAGMAPLKPYFTGLQVPPSKRVTTCQKCIRTGDIENVGKTSRHGTFFEMLGNFSFGDYFKEEIIPWAWEFVTQILMIPKDRLYVTIYLDDDEAYSIWTSKTDIDKSRIFRLGKEDNFWEHGLGPCGPCSEIHFDREDNNVIDSVESFVKAGEEDRVVEFWNLVFTQFDKDEEGNYNRLPNPNIDTGMGLERVATIMQNTRSIFEIDTIRSILDEVCRIGNLSYGTDPKEDISIRIITDHIRSIAFMISDGITPSNEGRGYVLRRLLRRAARHGRLLGIKGSFLSKLLGTVIKNSCSNYPELKEKEDYIEKIISIEEARFDETIDAGMAILKEYIDKLEIENRNVLLGENAFKLYDTFGFPIELTEEILEEKGMKVDKPGFNEEMKKQREMGRKARKTTNYMGVDISVLDKIPLDTKVEFTGYGKLESLGKVLYIIKDEEIVNELNSGEKGVIVTDKTPFYAEMGGQIGDTGTIEASGCNILVSDCRKNISGKVVHFVEIKDGIVKVGDTVSLKVCEKRRRNICKNHTATHMLQAALREVLGQHVHQSGSYVDDEKLRFDFNHYQALSKDELKKVEDLVNEKIMDTIQIKTDVMNIEEAKKSGAMALFDEKYANEVRVVKVDTFSKELCGGTHVKNSGEIGFLKLISETGVAAGVRRIEAVTGFNAIKYEERKEEILNEIQEKLKCKEQDIIKKIENQSSEIKEMEKEINSLKLKLATSSIDDLLQNVVEINGSKLLTGILKDTDNSSLREICDKLKSKIGDGTVVLGSSNEGKVSLIAMASQSEIEKGVHCGKIIKEVASICGGGGGGRPNMAEAGGKKPEKLKEAIEQVKVIMENLVK